MIDSTIKHKNKDTGDLGEKIACKYLESNGHTVIQQNFWRKYGELDIITTKNNLVHFVEVKSVSYETKSKLLDSVTRATWLPEERVDDRKLRRIYRTIESWIASHGYSGEWQIDVITVRFVRRETFASVKLIENIIV